MSNGDKSSKTNPENKKINLGLPIILLVLLGGFAIWQTSNRKIDVKDANIDKECTSRAYAEIGGPFNLVNQNGENVSEKNYLGKPALIYFGYTYCPDVCPTSLTFMGSAMSELEKIDAKLASEVQPILISFDPKRDTKEKLKEYVTTPAFPKNLIGLTGTEEATNAAAKAYKVTFKKNDETDKENYTVDHSSIIYLLGRDGKLKSFFSDNVEPKKMAQCIATLNKNGL